MKTRSHLIFMAVACQFVFLIFPEVLRACTLSPQTRLLGDMPFAIGVYDSVFLAEVKGQRPLERFWEAAELHVLEDFVGETAVELDVANFIGSTCSWALTPGNQYLIFAHHPSSRQGFSFGGVNFNVPGIDEGYHLVVGVPVPMEWPGLSDALEFLRESSPP